MRIPVNEQVQGVLLLEKPDQPSGWFQAVKAAMTYTQLGLSVAAPLILSVLFAHWLQRKLALGSWVSLLGLLVGLAALAEGFIKVDGEKTLVLASACEWADEIDIVRAQKAEERAKELLKSAESRIEHDLAERKLKRALNRLHIAK